MDWKWSVAPDGHGIPTGWVIDGANRRDLRMLEPTLEAAAERGLLAGMDQFEIQLRGMGEATARSDTWDRRVVSPEWPKASRGFRSSPRVRAHPGY